MSLDPQKGHEHGLSRTQMIRTLFDSKHKVHSLKSEPRAVSLQKRLYATSKSGDHRRGDRDGTGSWMGGECRGIPFRPDRIPHSPWIRYRRTACPDRGRGRTGNRPRGVPSGGASIAQDGSGRPPSSGGHGRSPNQAGWAGSPCTVPVVLGTTSGGMGLGEAYFRRCTGQPPVSRGLATLALHYQPQTQVSDVMEALGFEGATRIISNACASGANAVGEAFEMIRNGHAERVVTGGYDALTQLVFAGFDSLQALSTTRCLPFDTRRDGLALGEGAGILCLEPMDAAHARGATILAEIVGYGASTDTHHLTQPDPSGEAALESMTEACAQAGIRPSEVGYINAHGTGTRLNDAAETQAIHRWAGDATPRIPVSSTKSGIGHLLGAAGAVEAVACIMALRGQWLPPEPEDLVPDPLCRFPVVQSPTSAQLDHALSNSFGFGGANASLVFRKA